MATLPPGTQVGPYQVTGEIGSGGMGEVFRARDLTLHRDVALKVLLPVHGADAGRQRRFAREARLLASLNHPHVAQIYGIEESAAGPVIAMEYVDGRTLRDLLHTGGLPRAGTPELARQIASALDAAHEKGFIHRDLKPANIMVTPDGSVKILDFGLARAWAQEDDDANGQEVTMSATTIGEVVGTPAYMSPEQATGERVDRRTDIWAFGCVLFEMLAGRPAFPGHSVQDTLARVIAREPDWDVLPADTPAALRALVARCLEKDQRRRLRDIGDALYELKVVDGAASATGGASALATAHARPTLNGPMAFAVAGAVLVGAFVTWALLTAGTPVNPARGAAPIRFALPPPPGLMFGGALPSLEATTLEASPDGSRFAFIASGPGAPPHIWIRTLGDESAVRLDGTEGAVSMFWSPDGRALGFFADAQLRRIDLDGGAPVKIADVAVKTGLSGTWSAAGTILFSAVQGEAIFRVSVGGGTPVPVITVDKPGQRVVWPRFLPDGRRFLYTELNSDFKGRVMLADGDGPATSLFDAQSHTQWVDPDWVLFVREGTLLAQRVDLQAKRVVGDPVSVAGRVAYSAATGWANFTASPGGALAFQTSRDENRLTWFDRAGRETGYAGEPGAYFTLSLSSDDRTVLFTRQRPELGTYDIWSMDLSRQSETPVTTSPGMETGEVWLSDGREVLYAAATGTAPNIYHKNLSTGVERRLLTSPRFQFPTAVTSDRARIFYQQRTEQGTWDVMSMTMTEPREPTPVLSTPFSEHTLRMAPSGKYVAYVSDESTRPQVYVAPYPSINSKVMVSSTGGGRPRWSRRSDELYFLSSGQLMVTTVDVYGQPGQTRPLFGTPGWLDFDVTNDGRILANVSRVVARELPISVIVNWSPPPR